MNYHKTSNCRLFGFTLIELLMVVGVIAILMSILLPALRTARDTSMRISCSNNERHVYLGWLNYCENYGGMLPGWKSDTWANPPATNQYWTQFMADQFQTSVYKIGNYYRIRRKSILMCPKLPMASDPEAIYPAYGMNNFGIGREGSVLNSKIYNKLSDIRQPSQLVAFGDAYIPWTDPFVGCAHISRDLTLNHLRHRDKTNIVFTDGHVELQGIDFLNPAWGWWDVAPWGSP
jgi:prepilin-type N-terminal cleavage/methylation domain-containing protein/prepilin-type processing-associated H-X9-DG protein